MIFVIDSLKYDTDKMTLISDKCEWTYTSVIFGKTFNCKGKNVKLYKSSKGNWLLTFEKDYHMTYALKMTEEVAKNMLMGYDVKAYEKEFVIGLIKETFEEHSDEIIKMAAEILADSFKRTKKWKEVACDAIEEVSK